MKKPVTLMPAPWTTEMPWRMWSSSSPLTSPANTSGSKLSMPKATSRHPAWYIRAAVSGQMRSAECRYHTTR